MVPMRQIISMSVWESTNEAYGEKNPCYYTFKGINLFCMYITSAAVMPTHTHAHTAGKYVPVLENVKHRRLALATKQTSTTKYLTRPLTNCFKP